MGIIEIIFLGIALSMDAFAVSVSNGMCIRQMSFKKSFYIAFAFGFFQALMPILGFFGAGLFYNQIKLLDHWIALILLGYLGGKMIFEALKHDKEQECSIIKLTFKILIVQSIATSIDALAVGISLSAVDANIWISALIIGISTFVICLPAVFIGKKFGDLLNKKAEFLGGLILIIIGVKIFLEHFLTK